MRKILLLFILFLPVVCFGADKYVDSAAGTGGAGTEVDPYDTLSDLTGQLSAGDTAYLKRGSTFTETLTVDASGSAGNPITYTAYSTGVDPIITGQSSCIANPVKNYITIDGITITAFTQRGIHVTNSNNVIIKNCNISGGDSVGGQADFGIQVQGTNDTLNTGIQIIDNIIGTIGTSEKDTVFYTGIIVQETDGAVIARNSVNTTYSVGIRHVLGASTDNMNGLIEDNDVYGCYGGILVSNSDTTVVRYNKIRDGKGIGIGVAYDSDDAEVYGNLIYNLPTKTTNLWNGIDINHDSQDGVAYNNTVYGVTGNSFVIDDETASCDGWVIKNNIFDGSANTDNGAIYGICFRINGSGISYTSDYNILYPKIQTRDTVVNPVFYDKDADTYETLVTRQTNTYELNSLDSDPLFTDPTNDIFTLQPTSPARSGAENLVGYENRLDPDSEWPDSVSLLYSPSTIGAFSGLAVSSTAERKVWDKGVKWVRTFTGANVAEGTQSIFAIPMRYTEGVIHEITFESASTAWSVMLSSVDGVTTANKNTFLKFSETSDTYGRHAINPPRTYYNEDSPIDEFIYATITATTVATGVWTLKIKEEMK